MGSGARRRGVGREARAGDYGRPGLGGGAGAGPLCPGGGAYVGGRGHVSPPGWCSLPLEPTSFALLMVMVPASIGSLTGSRRGL